MPLRIVLIDTDPERAQALEEKLLESGFAEVVRVPEGPDLAAAVERIGPDLVIIDMALPDRDALEDVRAVSSSHPVVMFAGGDDPAFAEEAIAAPEFHGLLKQLGHPIHSVMRGFPLRTEASWPDHRFELHINRLAREIARCRIGLALSSGGAKALAHIGVIQVLEEYGIEVDCIAGSSMGAYVGSIWAYGLDGTRLEKIARELEGRWGLMRLIDPVIPPRRGFIRTRRTIARLRRSIGDAHFSDLIRPLRVLATRLDTLERVVFSSGEVAPAVDASIAIPGVCVPVTLDKEIYIDGGIADPLPVDVLMEMGIERIIAVNVIPTPERLRYWLDCEREKNGRESAGEITLFKSVGAALEDLAAGIAVYRSLRQHRL